MNIIKTYPYEGKFTREIDISSLNNDDFPYPIGDDYLRDSDGNIYETKPIILPSAPASEKIKEIEVLSVNCDVTEASAYASTTVLGSKYVVSFDYQEDISIKRGDTFEADVYGLRVNGEVLAIFPTQLGVKIYLSDIDN